MCVQTHLIFTLDDDDWHWGGRPAVLGGKRLVTVPENNNLKEKKKKDEMSYYLHQITELYQIWSQSFSPLTKNNFLACCWINSLNIWHLRALRPANVTLLWSDWMLKSQKGNWSDKIFPIMGPEWFVQFSP